MKRVGRSHFQVTSSCDILSCRLALWRCLALETAVVSGILVGVDYFDFKAQVGLPERVPSVHSSVDEQVNCGLTTDVVRVCGWVERRLTDHH